ncbi:MAG: GNAT family N-acetyltransferase [Bacteroidetes bacterium]|jgi:GNAT superfamily N-acetyltransferase|nr:GNAT family N-acetyltransferase [Bacteroidota bacterium]MBT5530580.1 GNAT family N-acetyltransferase [Cytophagia bacterium]MBT3422259.1 GNAT family N-acetyltransferase [Bacteroidota bacterium]MBT3800349.1 GNAT family N-acetyltransferase [Bacteroidota bacterium]MBT3935666.1 GNAT family N-acetyltransferase [Bacteroidota bacterium]
MSFVIRTANKKDIDTIVLFQIYMARETEGLELNEEIVKEGVKNAFNTPNHGQYFIAEDNGVVVGSLLITYEWSDWRNGTVWWIQSVYIRKENRGQKVFKRMFEFLKEKVTKSSEIKGLRLYVDKRNTSAIKVYQAIGMDSKHYDMFEWFPFEIC